MARYSKFLGRTVVVHYRAGDILLPASGRFVGDSGRSIFLEQHFLQRGQERHFRWEIPYQHIVRLEQKMDVAPEPPAALQPPQSHPHPPVLKQAAAVGHAADSSTKEASESKSAFLTIPNNPETA